MRAEVDSVLEARRERPDAIPEPFSISFEDDAEARSYVYNVLCAMLDNELTYPIDAEWLLGGVTAINDQRRVARVAREVLEQLRKKAR